ncbi:hypothetical protein [Acidovorax sp. NO-1]|uniref:hypothetical protein n=1 Tax=Acidovorax sp. NO-1 TaxID=512030 RepID=UPI00135F19FF|nr:hypothetical protein [Acidovorax sp. NO-1]
MGDFFFFGRSALELEHQQPGKAQHGHRGQGRELPARLVGGGASWGRGRGGGGGGSGG